MELNERTHPIWPYEILSGGFKGLTNYRMSIPGSSVTVSLGRWDWRPDHWFYSLWEAESDGDETLVASGSLDMPPGSYADQAGRVAFLLEIDYTDRNW